MGKARRVKSLYNGVDYFSSTMGNRQRRTWILRGRTDAGIIDAEVRAHSFWKKNPWKRATEVEVHWWFNDRTNCSFRNLLSLTEIRNMMDWIDWAIGEAITGLPYRPTLRIQHEKGDIQADVRRRLYHRYGNRWTADMDVIYE